MSCKKAQQFFEQKEINVKTVSDARKEPFDSTMAWGLIAGVQTVYIGKGKKILSFNPGDKDKEQILKAALGRTGNLRAPAVKTGNRLFIGYNDQIYEQL